MSLVFSALVLLFNAADLAFTIVPSTENTRLKNVVALLFIFETLGLDILMKLVWHGKWLLGLDEYLYWNGETKVRLVTKKSREGESKSLEKKKESNIT